MKKSKNKDNYEIMGFCYSWLFGFISGMAIVGSIFAFLCLK